MQDLLTYHPLFCPVSQNFVFHKTGSPLLSRVEYIQTGNASLPGRTSLRKWGPTSIADGSSYVPVSLSYQPRLHRRIYGLASAFLLPAARKRASGVRDAQLFPELILGQLVPDVLGCLCLILAHRAI